MNKPDVLLAVKTPTHIREKISQFCHIQDTNHSFPIPREDLLNRLENVEGLYTAGHTIDAELLERAPKLKVVSTASVGYNNFDIPALLSRGVVGTHTPYVLDDTVADLVMGLMLSVARRLPELDRYVRSGWWKNNHSKNFFGTDVHHKTLGIIGMGRIGLAIAKRAKFGFDMNVMYYNRNPNIQAEEQMSAQYAPLEDVLSEADFVVLMVPLTDHTYRLIGEEQLKLMKKDAIFINASRGKTVNELALVKALQEGWIAGAGLDVFEKEPLPQNHPFQNMDNVVLLPHIGSATYTTRLRMAETAGDNLIHALTGKQPVHVIPELQSLIAQN